MMLFGRSAWEHHMMNVMAISFLTPKRMTVFQVMNKNHVGHLLVAIFVDAWAYFNTTANEMMGTPRPSPPWIG